MEGSHRRREEVPTDGGREVPTDGGREFPTDGGRRFYRRRAAVPTEPWGVGGYKLSRLQGLVQVLLL